MTEGAGVRVRVVPIERPAGAFQQPVPTEALAAICRRALGPDVAAARLVELAGGTYNTTYRVEPDTGPPVVLRVAPRTSEPRRQAMRNEYATLPFLAGLGELVPRLLAADFSHQLLDRDWMVLSLLPGVALSAVRDRYSGDALRHLYRQLGTITRRIHSISGTGQGPEPAFGPAAGPHQPSWSAALIARFHERAADLAAAGLPGTGVLRVIEAAERHRAVLDEIVVPSLLHGDLWTVNLLVDGDEQRPSITGVLDCDAASWGDPLADWTIHQIRLRTGTEVDAFWQGYGTQVRTPGAELRAAFYRADHLLGARLDIHRRGLALADIPPMHWDLTPVLAELR